MQTKELDSFKLSDAVTFHDELNPKLWVGNKLRPEVKMQLTEIAKDFLEEMGINDLDVTDITVSGSNAAYSYTKHSDLDLHILVNLKDLPNNEVYKELFQAKKTLYNDSHNITIHGVPVELYVQDASDPVVSLGEYSIKNDKWIKIPTKRRANFDQTASRSKYNKLLNIVKSILESKNLVKVNKILKKIKQYRQAGLDKGGEFGPENLAYKALRSQGYITKLYNLRDKLHSEILSIEGMYANQNKIDKLAERLAKEFSQQLVTDEDYDPNGIPPGPEFKPTMPKGTVKVDVSDVYDWYKLGQHVSNLKGLGKHDFGKGPPSTILSFGDEDTEHKYINDLEKTGLSTTDIDPVDPNQPKGMKRQKVDPTYNVAEGIQHKKITELFDVKTSFPLKWDTQFASSGEVHAQAYDADGRTIDISFTPTGYGDGIEIVFKRGGSYDMTGHGDAPRVLATVVNAIGQYLQKYQPPYIAFSAKSTGGRAGAYAAMIRRLARGYTLLAPDEYPEDTKGFLDFLGSDTPFILARNAKMDTQGVAEGKITLSTDPNWYGATVDNYQASGPVVNIPANQLVGFEPDDKMNQPKSKVNVEKIVAGLKQGAKLPPLLVRKYKNGYQVLDGHHRFWAYKLLGVKSIPAQIVPDSDIEEISKQGVAEGLEQSLSSMVSQDQAERNEYATFVKSQAGGDWSKGAKMYAQLKKRPIDDIFGDAIRLNQFMKMKFDFDKFTNADWDNYWLLAQHCDNNRDFQKNALSIIKKYQGTDHSHYKYLYDRISMGLTGKQKYGTQNVKEQGVAEAFNNPYKTKSEKSEYGDVDMLAKLPDGTNLSIMFNKQQDDDGEEITQVEFYRNNSQEVTGEGDAQRIFATVLTSIQKYIKKYKPMRLSFSASKVTDPTIYYEPDQPRPNPESRAKLYDRLVQRYARAWGYRAFRADTGDLVIYELSRLKPAVVEDETLQYAAEKTPAINPYGGLKDRQYRGSISEMETDNQSSAKTGIYQSEVFGAKAYHSKCLEKGCDWESRRFDRIKQAQDAAKKHSQTHFKTDVAEASGYIPSEKEKNDPRFKTALTVDIHPNTMKKDAKKFGN